jgi:hypothetical protein
MPSSIVLCRSTHCAESVIDREFDTGVVSGQSVCLVASQFPHPPSVYLEQHLPRTYGSLDAPEQSESTGNEKVSINA